MNPAIEVTDLVVRRGKREVLHGLNCSIPRGEVTGLLGPSGSGKTTLMRAIVGVQIIKSGRVTVLGEPAGSAGLRRRVGYLTQDPSVYGDLTVRENTRYFASLYGLGAAEADRVIRKVGLADAAGQLINTLSGGQHSRASLACALVSQPEVLVLDEPTVGQDPVLRDELWHHFRELASNGTTLLVVVPILLLTLLYYMFESQALPPGMPSPFDRIGLIMLGVFPFVIMFLITSVAMLRERTSGTLERLLTTPLGKVDLLFGYGVAFGIAAAIQASIAASVAYWLFDLDTAGATGLVILIAIANAVLGVALGLFCSAFARTEFQALQFMPVVVLPQALLCGLFVPRDQMAGWLEGISNALPMSYAVEALQEVGANAEPSGTAAAALLRSAMSNEWTVRLLREFLSTQILRRVLSLAELDPVEAPYRASLVASQMAGLAMVRYIVKLEPLASAPPEWVVASVAPTIQRYVTGELPAPTQERVQSGRKA